MSHLAYRKQKLLKYIFVIFNLYYIYYLYPLSFAFEKEQKLNDILSFFSSGKAYFRGPWLVTPPEIPPQPSRKFYKQEAFLSTLEDTNPLVGIVGRCAVLHYNDYISCK